MFFLGEKTFNMITSDELLLKNESINQFVVCSPSPNRKEMLAGPFNTTTDDHVNLSKFDRFCTKMLLETLAVKIFL